MMRMLKHVSIAVMAVLVFAGTVLAAEVRVFKPMEEGMSQMQLRRQALDEGFAQAVLDEAVKILPGELDETRRELFRQYLLPRAGAYVREYKVIYSQALEAGVILRLNVRVNQSVLRDGLVRMGFMETLAVPLPVTVERPEDLSEEEALALDNLLVLTNAIPQENAGFRFILSRGAENLYRGQLMTPDREWTALDKDMANLWFTLWAHHFNRAEVRSASSDRATLAVSGWFSPDGVLEFQRVVGGWDSVVRDVNLLDMDMESSGVGASWSFRIMDAEGLKRRLDAYLPERGLRYQIVREADK